MKQIKLLLIVGMIAMISTGCMSTHQTITRTTPDIYLGVDNLEITEPITASAVTTRVFGIDWQRLFAKRTASIQGNVYTTLSFFDHTDMYAIYALLKENPGYDLVLYPQFTIVNRTPFLGLGILFKETEVKVTARMAKIRSKE